LATESPKNGVIVGQKRHEDFSAQVVDVVLDEADASRVGRVRDHMHKQTHEAVDEILPGSRLFSQASLQKIAINFGEGHVTAIPAGTLFAKAALSRATGGPHRPLDQWRVDH